MQTPAIHQKPFPREESPSKEQKMALVNQAFDLIRDDLNEHERMGKYLFRVIHCSYANQRLENQSSPLR
jgi:hypothetical protein